MAAQKIEEMGLLVFVKNVSSEFERVIGEIERNKLQNISAEKHEEMVEVPPSIVLPITASSEHLEIHLGAEIEE